MRAEDREGQWVNKSSTGIECRNLLNDIPNEEDCFVPTQENTTTFEATAWVEKPKILKAAR